MIVSNAIIVKVISLTKECRMKIDKRKTEKLDHYNLGTLFSWIHW